MFITPIKLFLDFSFTRLATTGLGRILDANLLAVFLPDLFTFALTFFEWFLE